MPVNVRNVWVDLYVDGRSTVGTGPRSKDGAMSATFRQRSDGAIGDHRVKVGTYVTGGGGIVTEASIDTERRDRFPSLILSTHRDKPGALVTLDVPGLDGAVAWVTSYSGEPRAAFLTFRTEAERDAFLSTLAAWRDAHQDEAAEVSA